MLALLEPGIHLDFDPNLLLVQVAGTYKDENATLDKRCGVCISRSGIIREHNPLIHFDEEALDFQDDPFPWSYIHPDEKAKWL